MKLPRFMSLVSAMVLSMALLSGCFQAPTPTEQVYKPGPTDPNDFSIGAHWDLLEAVKASGVTLSLNPKSCEPNVSGYYYVGLKRLVICQDHRDPTSNREVRWTDNDLNTIRHEVHHIIQDYELGYLGDHRLGRYFEDDDVYLTFVTSSLTPQQIKDITMWYSNGENDDHQIELELEAFAAAEVVSPSLMRDVLLNHINN